ncbi:MAG: DNA-3-methyladenine glycosylase 2 family protein [Clostridia bacterium]|nr:DNA-3-methyladenine glycosylase 2 family protein [Clostridia bacterium]
MEYKISKNKIQIFGKEDFSPEHILECGQIFSYEKAAGGHYVVFSTDKKAEIFETETGYEIVAENPTYFESFFDLQTDYAALKAGLLRYEILKEPIKFGHGIRILKQDLFETLISFIVSANNNIKRIQLILNRMREKFGTKMSGYYAFPTRKQLLAATEEDFSALGAGYRSKYLFKVLRHVNEDVLQDWQILSTKSLREKLISLAGVGPKVADCVLLFGFGRGDVFPVDTWIEKMYLRFYPAEKNLSREKIRFNLTDEFGLLSGYAQQYLFFFMRSGL